MAPQQSIGVIDRGHEIKPLNFAFLQENAPYYALTVFEKMEFLMKAPMIACIFFAALLSQPAEAASYSVSGAHITLVEGTYSPESIRFAVNVPAGQCGAGTFLFFYPRGSNDAQHIASASAVMSSLLTAKSTNSTISFGGDDNGCSVNYVISQ